MFLEHIECISEFTGMLLSFIWKNRNFILIQSITEIRMEILFKNRSYPKVSIFKNLFLKYFQFFSVGYLEIEDPQEKMCFGDTSSRLKTKVFISDPSLYRKLILGGSLSFSELYVKGKIKTDNLTNLIRIIIKNQRLIEKLDNSWSGKLFMGVNTLKYLLQKNTKHRAKKHIFQHYDLGNDFFQLFLDSTMMYSSAIFED